MTDIDNNTKTTTGSSGITGGRPKGFGSLIHEETRKEAELVEFALSILRG
jgi:hypothetical protein